MLKTSLKMLKIRSFQQHFFVPKIKRLKSVNFLTFLTYFSTFWVIIIHQPAEYCIYIFGDVYSFSRLEGKIEGKNNMSRPSSSARRQGILTVCKVKCFTRQGVPFTPAETRRGRRKKTAVLPKRLLNVNLAASHGFKCGSVFFRRHSGAAGGINKNVCLRKHSLKYESV